MDWDEAEQKKATGGTIGESLENFSVAELEVRLAELKAEIARVEKERERKIQLGAAASDVFKS